MTSTTTVSTAGLGGFIRSSFFCPAFFFAARWGLAPATIAFTAFPRADLEILRALARTAARFPRGLGRFFARTFVRFLRLATIIPPIPLCAALSGSVQAPAVPLLFQSMVRRSKPWFSLRRGSLSADVLGPLLLLGLRLCLGGGWELQHCCVLTFGEFGQKDLLTVRHLKDIVVDIRFVLVLLSENGGRELALDALAIDMGPTKLDGFVERKLGARKDTNRRRVTYRIVNRFESEVPRPKLWLTNLSATTAGRDLACCRLKSHIVRAPFLVWLRRDESPWAESYS